MAKSVKFTPDAARKIVKTVRDAQKQPKPHVLVTAPNRAVTGSFARGYLDGALSAASSAGATAATATMSVWAVIADVWTDTGNDVTITNRDTTLTLDAGDYVVAVVIGGEWTPIWGSC